MRTVVLPQVKRSANPSTEVKDLVGAGGVKVLDKAQGRVEAIVSVTGLEDDVEDVIEPRAYEKTLAVRNPKGIRSHDWDRPAMRTVKAAELMPGSHELPERTATGEPWPREAGALKVLMEYALEIKDGREGFELCRFYGDEMNWSVGYHVDRGHARMVKGIRHIDTMTHLFEYSDVLWGAMPLAAGAGVKSYGGIQVAGATTKSGLLVPDHALLEGKALAGTFEERRDRLDRALTEVLRGDVGENDEGHVRGWVNVVGTWPDRVVACFYSYSDDGPRHYEFDYAIDEAGGVTLDNRREVRVEESLVPVPAGEQDAAVQEKAPDANLTAADLAEQAALYESFTG